jgi:hypothetical protein
MRRYFVHTSHSLKRNQRGLLRFAGTGPGAGQPSWLLLGMAILWVPAFYLLRAIGRDEHGALVPVNLCKSIQSCHPDSSPRAHQIPSG